MEIDPPNLTENELQTMQFEQLADQASIMVDQLPLLRERTGRAFVDAGISRVFWRISNAPGKKLNHCAIATEKSKHWSTSLRWFVRR